jgi:predicted phosphodiesterase
MLAILSDIHGNLEALRAVLEDAGCHGVEAIYCLGDTVGYGPNPLECLDLTMFMRLVLLGNNDEGVLREPEFY